MLASEQKLACNNADILLLVLAALRVIRENGGFGSFEVKVKDGIARVVKPTIEWHLDT